MMGRDTVADRHELFAMWVVLAVLAAAMMAGYWTTDREGTSSAIRQTRRPNPSGALGPGE